tara:strand:- start:16 stop:177 length:162 start_codon:yes stop_codon:yes gene_type:complete
MQESINRMKDKIEQMRLSHIIYKYDFTQLKKQIENIEIEYQDRQIKNKNVKKT